MTERYFPFTAIPKYSKVVLYGAGAIGRQYYSQNQKLEWCDIIGALDINHSAIVDFPVPVFAPEKICGLDYDYIVISLSFLSMQEDEEISKIREILTGLGVEPDKIVYKPLFYLWQSDDVFQSTKGDFENFDDSGIKIAFLPMWTLGDQVMFLSVYQALTKLFDKGVIDVYVIKKIRKTVEAIYYQQKFLGNVYVLDRQDGEDLKDQYDLVIRVEYEPIILAADLDRLKKYAPLLHKSVEMAVNYQRDYGASFPLDSYTNRLRADRAKFWGLNAYTLLSANQSFPIDDFKVKINLNKSWEEEFKSLALGKYITFSNGGGKHIAKSGNLTKAWPNEYYEMLIKEIKHKFPQILVVQLGAAYTKEISCADKSILGKDIGLVMHILKNSMLHIDCESGLVHLATQLGTKCAVMFGPTPAWYFGYEGNENIVSSICTCRECYGLVNDWYYRCMRYGKPRCMWSISPNQVFERVSACLRSSYNAEI